jgi:hypothetical protein
MGYLSYFRSIEIPEPRARMSCLGLPLFFSHLSSPRDRHIYGYKRPAAGIFQLDPSSLLALFSSFFIPDMLDMLLSAGFLFVFFCSVLQ